MAAGGPQTRLPDPVDKTSGCAELNVARLPSERAEMITDLMVPRIQAAGDANALAAALRLAERLQAHVAVLEILHLPLPNPGPWGLASDMAMGQVYTEMRALAETRIAHVKEQLVGEKAPCEVRLVESLYVEPQRTVALHARYADLVVMTSADSSADAALVHNYFSALLLESGRPVLAVPPGYRMSLPLRHAVVAWRQTREAARAVHDALPLLQLAASIDVLEVGPVEASGDNGARPDADIAAHLARHGMNVRAVFHEQRSETVTSALLQHCRQSGAQLLVAGGYGHSRFIEWVLGGVTRELLQSAPVPVLFSH
jgi:nucleotide-binding universal stress UspA family protein